VGGDPSPTQGPEGEEGGPLPRSMLTQLELWATGGIDRAGYPTHPHTHPTKS